MVRLAVVWLCFGAISSALAQDAGAGTMDAGLFAEDAGREVHVAAQDADAGVADAPVALTLVPAEPERFDGGVAQETVVLGRREVETSGSVHVIKASDLERFERDDPHAVLRGGVPGVYVREEDGFGLRPNIGLRGANAERSKKVTLLEDGVLLGPAPYSAPAAYSFPLVTRVQSVRVVKGPSAISHGPQTVGGSIEFITRDAPRSQTFFIDVAGGDYLYGKAHGRFGVGDEKSGVLVEGVHLRNNGYKELDGGGDTGFFRNEWMVKARHVVAERHTLLLKAGFSNEVSNETYLGLTDEDFRENPNRRYAASRFDRMEWTRTQVALSHTYQLEGISVTTTAYRNDFDRSWRKVNRFRRAALADVLRQPESARNALFYGVLTGAADSSSEGESLMIGPNHRVFVSQGIQSTGSVELETGVLHHRLEAGVRWHYDRAERNHTEDAYVLRRGEPIFANEPTLTTLDSRDSTHALALHVADAILFGPLALTPGVRTELLRSQSLNRLTGRLSTGAANVLLPGIGLHGKVSEDVGAFAGVYRGFSPPPPGAGQTLPELSVNYEAGARWTPSGARVEAIGFFNDYSNLTNICTFSGGCVTENLDRQFSAGRAFIYGAEVFASKTARPVAGTRLPMSLAYTFTRTMLRDSFNSADPQFGAVREGDELPYVPEHQLAANVGIERERYGFNVAATYIGVMREKAGQGDARPGDFTDPLLTFDLNASYRPLSGLRVYFNVRNVLDQQVIVSRRPFGARPNAPRMLQLGVSYGF